MNTETITLEKVVEKLTRAQVVYDAKFEASLKTLSEMEVTDEKFNKLMDTCSSLIGLQIQALRTVDEYRHYEEQKKINQSMVENKGGNK